MDPLLRQSIWKHLVTLAQTEKITVVITTHYIEEARQANVVGLMRHGKLLAEDSPDNLMSQHGMDNLEDVFLKLCISDSSRKAAKLAGLGLQPMKSLKSGGGGKSEIGLPRPVMLDVNGLPINQMNAIEGSRVVAKKKRHIPSVFALTGGATDEEHNNRTTGDSGNAATTIDSSMGTQNESEEEESSTTGAESSSPSCSTDNDKQQIVPRKQTQEVQPDFVVNKNNLRSMVPGTKYAPKKVSSTLR